MFIFPLIFDILHELFLASGSRKNFACVNNWKRLFVITRPISRVTCPTKNLSFNNKFYIKYHMIFFLMYMLKKLTWFKPKSSLSCFSRPVVWKPLQVLTIEEKLFVSIIRYLEEHVFLKLLPSTTMLDFEDKESILSQMYIVGSKNLQILFYIKSLHILDQIGQVRELCLWIRKKKVK